MPKLPDAMVPSELRCVLLDRGSLRRGSRAAAVSERSPNKPGGCGPASLLSSRVSVSDVSFFCCCRSSSLSSPKASSSNVLDERQPMMREDGGGGIALSNEWDERKFIDSCCQ